MDFVMRRSENSISDRHYLMEIPAGAIVVAPEPFFARFGKSFSIPNRETLSAELKLNRVYHAVPSDKKRKDLTPYVVRRIHSSRIKDALAGKMAEELLSPEDKLDAMAKSQLPKDEAKPVAEKINVFSLTLAQLKEKAAEHKIDTKKMTRAQITKALQTILQKEDAEN